MHEQQCRWVQWKRTHWNDVSPFLLCFYSKLTDTKMSHDENGDVQYKGVWKYLFISHKLMFDTKNDIYMYGMACRTAVSGHTKAHPSYMWHLVSFVVSLHPFPCLNKSATWQNKLFNLLLCKLCCIIPKRSSDASLLHSPHSKDTHAFFPKASSVNSSPSWILSWSCKPPTFTSLRTTARSSPLPCRQLRQRSTC